MTTTHPRPADDPPHPHRAGCCDWITFLVTGPNAKLLAWQFAAMSVVELFDLRGQTVRCRTRGEAADRGQRAYERAVALAQRYDMTLQDLVDSDPPRERLDPSGRRRRRDRLRLCGGMPRRASGQRWDEVAGLAAEETAAEGEAMPFDIPRDKDYPPGCPNLIEMTPVRLSPPHYLPNRG
jgi:hypothetical protein